MCSKKTWGWFVLLLLVFAFGTSPVLYAKSSMACVALGNDRDQQDRSKPDKPGKPDKPDKPSKPDKPDKPDSCKPNDPPHDPCGP